jgi:hypothetical protein
VVIDYDDADHRSGTSATCWVGTPTLSQTGVAAHQLSGETIGGEVARTRFAPNGYDFANDRERVMTDARQPLLRGQQIAIQGAKSRVLFEKLGQ